ncbi:MAG: signal peptidase I [Tannerella sp.]|jgi:signal peptidase I|nr:signal peptidase I [Tannerella sp.]
MNVNKINNESDNNVSDKRHIKIRLINFGIWAVLLILFSAWMGNWWLLLGLLFFIDVYITKFVPWGAWKKSQNPQIQKILDWTDDILFALIFVYFINIFIFQNYQIPSSSLEKTLLVGDFLFVSKLSYGPRVPNTPISFPLVQNTLPILNCKSYIEWPNWGYKRVKGTGHVERNDIVVFNFPAGDTVCLKMQSVDIYTIRYVWRENVENNKAKFGDIIYRPVDKRENYVKRCVGMPGDSLQIIDNKVYIDGKILEDKKYVQYVYFVETDGLLIKDDMFKRLNVSVADRSLVAYQQETTVSQEFLRQLGFTPVNGMYNPIYRLPLTTEALAIVKKMPSIRHLAIEPVPDNYDDVYPVDYKNGWTRDNYGPIWIPKKGATITLDKKNIALYHRCIRNYENNELEVRPEGSVFLNGIPVSTYTFKYDYYWMMGDNRHNSADSRSWGFVPEDHIVGKPLLVWLSIDSDRGIFDGFIRWKRLFHTVESFN